MTNKVDRRSLLAGCAAAAILARMPGAARAAPSIGPDAFLRLSERLTGKSSLDPDLAAQFLAAFDGEGRGAELSRLVDGGAPGADTVAADEVVAAWYTGLVPGKAGSRLVTYDEALVWSVLSYTKPAGYCGGAMGYWADPPEE